MTIKKSLENRIRGWLPKEPSCSNTFTTQMNQKVNKHPKIRGYLGLFAAMFVAVSLMLLALDALGLESYGSIAAGAAVPVAVVVYVVLFKKPRELDPETVQQT
jgi:hypothetical protein